MIGQVLENACYCGLRPMEVMEFTPGELFCYMTQWQRRQNDLKEWSNWRSALICSTMANLWRNKNSKAYTVNDFLPSAEKKRKVMTANEIAMELEIATRSMGGIIIE